jgi:hypothetical protein
LETLAIEGGSYRASLFLAFGGLGAIRPSSPVVYPDQTPLYGERDRVGAVLGAQFLAY